MACSPHRPTVLRNIHDLGLHKSGANIRLVVTDPPAGAYPTAAPRSRIASSAKNAGNALISSKR